MAESELLAEFPGAVAGLARAVAEGGRRLELTSLARLAGPETAGNPPPITPDLFALAGASLSWRMLFRRSGQEVVFFFFRRTKPSVNLLDGRIDLRVAPVVPETIPARPAAGAITHAVIFPPFVMADPPQDVMDTTIVADDAGDGVGRPTRDDTTVFRVGPGGSSLLVLRRAENRRGKPTRRIRLIEGGRAEIVVGSKKDGSWPVRPFLLLFEAIREGVMKGLETGERVALVPGPPPPVPTPSYVRQILWAFTRAYPEAIDAVRAVGLDEAPEWAGLTSRFDVPAFTGDVTVRLDADGFAADEGDEETFQMRFRTRIERQGDAVDARVTLGPPDFLAGGALFAAFIAALAPPALPAGGGGVGGEDPEQAVSRRIAGDIAFAAVERGFESSDAWYAFVRTAAPVAGVFRTVRRVKPAPTDDDPDAYVEYDRDIAVLRGLRNGAELTVIIQFAARVRAATAGAGPARTVTLVKGDERDSVQWIYPTRRGPDGRFGGRQHPNGTGEDEPVGDLVTYAHWLAAATRLWVRVLM